MRNSKGGGVGAGLTLGFPAPTPNLKSLGSPSAFLHEQMTLAGYSLLVHAEAARSAQG